MGELAAFLGIAILVIVTPGQDTALTIRNTMLGGRPAGVGTAAGVAAGQAAGLTVVAVGEGPQEELLRGFGAERVVSSLNTLLDFRLR